MRKIDIIGLGEVVVDWVAEIPHFPKPDEKIDALSENYFAGGVTANYLVAIARLGVSCGFIGAIGDDSYADFLIEDFGFKEKYIDLYFSGSRGYHCHVMDPKIFCLDSSERREIVDYITGRDLKDSLVFHERVTGKRSYGRVNYPSGKTLRMPLPDEPGWRGRISREIIEIINEIRKSDDPIEKLRGYGVKK